MKSGTKLNPPKQSSGFDYLSLLSRCAHEISKKITFFLNITTFSLNFHSFHFASFDNRGIGSISLQPHSSSSSGIAILNRIRTVQSSEARSLVEFSFHCICLFMNWVPVIGFCFPLETHLFGVRTRYSMPSNFHTLSLIAFSHFKVFQGTSVQCFIPELSNQAF